MDTIKKLSDYAILTGQTRNLSACPRTIDNDLALTDTPGFGSAAKYIGASTKEVIRDAEGLTYKEKNDHDHGDHGTAMQAGSPEQQLWQKRKTAKDRI